MKKYIRVCMCCGNTFETDIPAFHIAADGAIYRTNYNILFHLFLLSLTNFSKSLYVTLFGSIPSFLRTSISS